jgi:hypothetical protein
LNASVCRLLAAVLLTFAAASQVSASQVGPTVQTPGLNLSSLAVRAEMGRVAASGGTLQLTLDEEGRIALRVPLPSVEAARFPVLHVQFAAPPRTGSLGVFWKTRISGQQMMQYWVPGSVGRSVYLNLGAVDFWEGELLELALLVKGAPKQELTIETAELLPTSIPNITMAILDGWLAFVPWDMSSINAYPASRSAGAWISPVPVVAIVFFSSVFAYGLLLALSRGRWFLDWRVVATVFIVCWFSIDLAWQAKILQQLEVTHSQFSGKNSEAKQLAGDDAALFQFANDVRVLAGSKETRVFVASADDYAGMRANYFLYPLNVFWQRKGGELPPQKYFRAGDYIMQIMPSRIRFDKQRNVLQLTKGPHLPVRLIASGQMGSLFQVI